MNIRLFNNGPVQEQNKKLESFMDNLNPALTRFYFLAPSLTNDLTDDQNQSLNGVSSEDEEKLVQQGYYNIAQYRLIQKESSKATMTQDEVQQYALFIKQRAAALVKAENKSRREDAEQCVMQATKDTLELYNVSQCALL